MQCVSRCREGELTQGWNSFQLVVWTEFLVILRCLFLSNTKTLRLLIFQTPCCDNLYRCRFCHDEEQNHTLRRDDVKEIECSECGLRQEVQQSCPRCGTVFGKVTPPSPPPAPPMGVYSFFFPSNRFLGKIREFQTSFLLEDQLKAAFIFWCFGDIAFMISWIRGQDKLLRISYWGNIGISWKNI